MDNEAMDMADRNETPLGSWKEIGAYLHRDARTVRRWEKEEGLPIHRHAHKGRASVYAYPSELDAWQVSRKVAPEPPRPRPLWKIPAFAATMLLCLIMVGNGLRPQTASAQAGNPAVRELWPTRQDVQGVSPDGRYIASMDWNQGAFFLHDATTGEDTRLLEAKSGDYAASAAFSADSSLMAYTWFSAKEKRFELRVIPVRGGGTPRTLQRGASDDFILPSTWTSDGRRILAVRRLPDQSAQIVFVSTQDGSVQALKSVGWRYTDVSLSPDERYVAYDSPTETRRERDIFVIAADGSQGAAVVENPAEDVQPLWTPDGSRILFTSTRTGNLALWSIRMKDGKPDGAPEPLQAPADLSSAANAWLTRNGSLYYFNTGVRVNIYSAPLNADQKGSRAPQVLAERFVNANNGPALSPDGSRLAYLSIRQTGSVVVIRDLKSGDETEAPAKVPVNMIYGQGPLWFPDGRSLLILSREPNKAGQGFYRLDISTGKADLLTRVLPQMLGYALAPDGKTLYYSERAPDASAVKLARLVRFDLETRSEAELRTGELFHKLAVSPDSKQIAYLSTGNGTGETAWVAVMPAGGGEAKEVFRSQSLADKANAVLSWSPDPRSLLLANGSEVWRIPAAGGNPEVAFTVPNLDIHSPQIDRDGKRIFFAGFEQHGSGVWTIENFMPGRK